MHADNKQRRERKGVRGRAAGDCVGGGERSLGLCKAAAEGRVRAHLGRAEVLDGADLVACAWVGR